MIKLSFVCSIVGVRCLWLIEVRESTWACVVLLSVLNFPSIVSNHSTKFHEKLFPDLCSPEPIQNKEKGLVYA